MERGRKKIEGKKSKRKKKAKGKKSKVRKEIILLKILHIDTGQHFSAEPGHSPLCLGSFSCLFRE